VLLLFETDKNRAVATKKLIVIVTEEAERTEFTSFSYNRIFLNVIIEETANTGGLPSPDENSLPTNTEISTI
jgi:hypothetical protein